MAADDSWWLKLGRAQKHVVDIKKEARRYARKHPYRFDDLHQPKGNFKIRHAVFITEQPSDDLALMFGDFVHNLRSALDHVIVASVPKKDRSNSTQFPFASTDPWAKRPDGDFVVQEPEARENFDRALRGIDDRARTIVIRNQPYRHRKPKIPWLLGLISSYDNADKHRELIVTGGGVWRVQADIYIAGIYQTTVRQIMDRREYAKESTVVGISLPAAYSNPLAPRVSEMQVKHRAVAKILVQVRDDGSGKPLSFPLYPFLRDSVLETSRILKLLEPFAIHK